MTVNFSSLTTDFEMFEIYELLSWYLHGCNNYNVSVQIMYKYYRCEKTKYHNNLTFLDS